MSGHGVHLGRTAHLSPASVWHVSVFTWHNVKEYLYFATAARETHFSSLSYCIPGPFTCVCIASDIYVIIQFQLISCQEFYSALIGNRVCLAACT